MTYVRETFGPVALAVASPISCQSLIALEVVQLFQKRGRYARNMSRKLSEAFDVGDLASKTNVLVCQFGSVRALQTPRKRPSKYLIFLRLD